jgi:hypothetical protein
MRLRWPDTILTDPEPAARIARHLFPEDFLDPAAFASASELDRCALPTHLLAPNQPLGETAGPVW